MTKRILHSDSPTYSLPNRELIYLIPLQQRGRDGRSGAGARRRAARAADKHVHARATEGSSRWAATARECIITFLK